MNKIVDKFTSGGSGIGKNSSSKDGIQPGFGGLIVTPGQNDVLSGRGGRINNHPGNLYYRTLVNKYKHTYLDKHTKKLDKVKIANEIVVLIRNTNPPGRFLKQESDKGWREIGDEKARKKAGQAMREKAPETRREMEEGKVQPIPVNSVMGAPGNVLSSPIVPNSPMHANLYDSSVPIVAQTSVTSMPIGSHSGSHSGSGSVASYPNGFPQAPPISYDPSGRINYASYHPSAQILSGISTQQFNGATPTSSYRPYSDIAKTDQAASPKGRQAHVKGKTTRGNPAMDSFRVVKSEPQSKEQIHDIIGAKGAAFDRPFNPLNDSDLNSDVSALHSSKTSSTSSNKTSISSLATVKITLPDSESKSSGSNNVEVDRRKKYYNNVMHESDLSYLPSQLTDQGMPTVAMEESIRMSEISLCRSPYTSGSEKEKSVDMNDLMDMMGNSVPDLNRPELTISDAQTVTLDWNTSTGRESSSSSSELRTNRERLKSDYSSDAMSFRLDRLKADNSSSDAMSFRLDKGKEMFTDDMSITSRYSNRSSTSSWLQGFKSMQGLPAPGERERLFSDLSQRSLLSEISTDMNALDLATDFPPFVNESSSPSSQISPSSPTSP